MPARIAAIYDIHGNLPALQAVLQHARHERVDHIVVGGDVVPGPMARETLDCLAAIDIPTQFIQGNGEAAVLAQMAGNEHEVPEQAREAVRWVAQQLGPEHGTLMAGWPHGVRLPVQGLGEILFCHATPRSQTEIFTRLTSSDLLASLFSGLDVSVVVCGHTHMQFDRIIGSTRVVNAGSVGMPFGRPGAHWLLLGADIDLRHTDYDLAKATEHIAATSYPHARDFARRYVLAPPSEEEMLDVFGKAELK